MTPRDQVIAAITKAGGVSSFSRKHDIQEGHLKAVIKGSMQPGKRTCRAAGVVLS